MDSLHQPLGMQSPADSSSEAFSRGNSNSGRSRDKRARGGRRWLSQAGQGCVRLHSISGGAPLPPPFHLGFSAVGILFWGLHCSPGAGRALQNRFLEQTRLSSGDARSVLEEHHGSGILAICSLSNQALLPWALPHGITSISSSKQTGQGEIPVP